MVFCKKSGAMQVLKCKMQCGQVWWCFARNLVQCRCPANARVECQIIYTLANARSNLVTFLLGKFWIVRGPKIDIDPTESKSVLKKPSSLLFTENDTAWYGSCNMVEEATGREMSRWLSNLSTDATFPAAAVAVADAAAAATRAAAAVADDADADADAPPVLFCFAKRLKWILPFLLFPPISLSKSIPPQRSPTMVSPKYQDQEDQKEAKLSHACWREPRGRRQQSQCNQIDKNVHWPNHTREILVISKVMMKIVPSWWITG